MTRLTYTYRRMHACKCFFVQFLILGSTWGVTLNVPDAALDSSVSFCDLGLSGYHPICIKLPCEVIDLDSSIDASYYKVK